MTDDVDEIEEAGGACWNMATQSVSPAPSYSSIMLTHGATARLIVN